MIYNKTKRKEETVMLDLNKYGAELVKGLEQKDIPLKFAYLANVRNWLELSREHYNDLIACNDREQFKTTHYPFDTKTHFDKEHVTIVDIGCGDGYPIIPFIREMRGKTESMTYLGVDISEALTDVAELNVKYHCGNIYQYGNIVTDYKKHVCDFDSGFDEIFAKVKDLPGNKIIFLLGGTLGNCKDPKSVLKEIEKFIGPEDYLFTEIKFCDKPEELKDELSIYSSPEHRDFILAIPTQLGFISSKRDEYELVVRWDTRLSAIVTLLWLKTDKVIKIGKKVVRFKSGDEIMLGFSKRFKTPNWRELIDEVINPDDLMIAWCASYQCNQLYFSVTKSWLHIKRYCSKDFKKITKMQ